jgi:predicted RNase H-like HicB family nuclease
MTGAGFEIHPEWDAEDRLWVSHVAALNDISSYGDTAEGALTQTREAILGYLEALEKEGLPLPRTAEPETFREALECRPSSA